MSAPDPGASGDQGPGQGQGLVGLEETETALIPGGGIVTAQGDIQKALATVGGEILSPEGTDPLMSLVSTGSNHLSQRNTGVTLHQTHLRMSLEGMSLLTSLGRRK